MPDAWNQPRPSQLHEAVAQALETMLSRPEYLSDQGEMLRLLREQLSTILTEAPIQGDVVNAVAIRAQLATVIDAEIAKLAARVS
ncbi:hypothetical protein [Muricoccus vinaceus]|uniref:Uncharacterized protein n=1 Tax=Muricoccus vinaceus TaxID=424704 RepID=A0ABV6IUG0_9PROT